MSVKATAVPSCAVAETPDRITVTSGLNPVVENGTVEKGLKPNMMSLLSRV
jgi:hypothetical protein